MAKKKDDFEEQMKKAIDAYGISRYQLSKESGVSESQLSLFMSGQRSLTLKSAGKIAEVIGLEIRSTKRKRGQK